MENRATGTDRIRSYLVALATIGMIAFNWLAGTGRLNGVTSGEVSDQFPTAVTPAGYAFSIWGLIYTGMVIFSIYQLLPANLVRYRAVRSLYILSCALNCAWLYFWHGGQIAICFAIIVALAAVLLAINYKLRDPQSIGGLFFANAPFGIYFGWVTAATLVNFAVMLAYLDVDLSGTTATVLGVVLILAAGAFGVAARLKLANYFYPLAIAWALTAIAVKQSGQTLIVIACALGVVACLIATMSFVMNLPSTQTPANR